MTAKEAQQLKYKQKVIVPHNGEFVWAEFDFVNNDGLVIKIAEGQHLVYTPEQVHKSKAALISELQAHCAKLLKLAQQLPD
jgi:hypothetical protein